MTIEESKGRTAEPGVTKKSVSDRLLGAAMPLMSLRSTGDEGVMLSALGGVTVIFLYPRTSSPTEPSIEGWESIPGAKGCTPQSQAFAEQYDALKAAGADRIFGLSSQSTQYHREVAARLRLPFDLLSDSETALALALNLPTFVAAGMTLYSRLTLVCVDSVVERVFFPVDEPSKNAGHVLDYLKSRR